MQFALPSPADALALVARAVALAAIVVSTGAVVFRWGVLHRWPDGGQSPVPAWNGLAARTGAIAAACLVVSAPVRWFAQARSLVQADDPVLPMMANVLRTMWGRGWLLQAAAAVTLLVGMILARADRRTGWALAALSVAALTLSPALMGHAVAAERLQSVSVGADWIHVAMAGAWVGALTVLAIVARAPAPAPSDGDAPTAPVATLIELFHPVALTCSAVLVLTGVVSLLLRVEHLVDLLHSAYGAILAVKLALTLGVAAFGLHHSRRGAATARGGGAVARTLAAEAVLAAMVVAATAVLVGTSPPTM